MRKISLRLVTQLAVVVVVFALAITHQRLGIEKAAPIDAYCPFGAVESFFTLIFTGEFLKRIFTSSFILMGIFLITSLFLGRVFCGYFCPLGAIQEWLRIIGRKIGVKKGFELPAKADKYLRYAKYFVLAAVIGFSFFVGDLVFRNYDPYNSLMHLGVEFEEKIFGYSILGLVLLVALFSSNLWCRYFCPLGAFFGLVRKIGFFRIKRDAATCISCGNCDRSCPAGLEIATADKVTSADCISCGKCVGGCPQSSLEYHIFGKKISRKAYAVLVTVLIVVPLIAVPFAPFWKTKADSNIVDSRGTISVEDLRGSNTLQYVIDSTGVPLEVFQDKLGLPAGTDTSLKLKDIGPEYGIKNKDGAVLEAEDFKAMLEEHLSQGGAGK